MPNPSLRRVLRAFLAEERQLVEAGLLTPGHLAEHVHKAVAALREGDHRPLRKLLREGTPLDVVHEDLQQTLTTTTDPGPEEVPVPNPAAKPLPRLHRRWPQSDEERDGEANLSGLDQAFDRWEDTYRDTYMAESAETRPGKRLPKLGEARTGFVSQPGRPPAEEAREWALKVLQAFFEFPKHVKVQGVTYTIVPNPKVPISPAAAAILPQPPVTAPYIAMDTNSREFNVLFGRAQGTKPDPITLLGRVQDATPILKAAKAEMFQQQRQQVEKRATEIAPEREKGARFVTDGPQVGSYGVPVFEAKNLDENGYDAATGWTIHGEPVNFDGDLYEDAFTVFEASHPEHGRVWGDLGHRIFATSRRAYEEFFRYYHMTEWDT